MSHFALAIDLPPIIRQLDVERSSTWAVVGLERVHEITRELRNVYMESPAITHREAAIAETFRDLAHDWWLGTRFQSSFMRATSHPAYQAILEFGDEVIPLVLRELQRKPDARWAVALRELTGDDPVRPEERGSTRAVADAWLRWGRDRNLI